MQSFIKYLVVLMALLSVSYSVHGQAPNLVNYQAVARDLTGIPLENTSVAIQYDIRSGSAVGTIVYSETHTTTTNQFGLFSAQIGGGSVLSGNFSTINWGTNLHYLQVTINGDVMPSTQLLSVPYALHATTAASGVPGVDGHSTLANSTADSTTCPNRGYLIDMGVDDNDDGTLQAGEIDISYYICNGLDGTANTNDTSATNEIQTLSSSGGLISLSNGGGSVIDSVNDADADPNNERITAFALNTASDSLIITESAVRHSFPLSKLSDGDWTKGAVGNDIYNLTDSVGIGTNNPKSPLQLGDKMHWFHYIAAPMDYGVSTYNVIDDGATLRTTQSGTSGLLFMGEDSGTPHFGVNLFPTLPAGTDILALSPRLKINLGDKGLAINADNADAGLEIAPIDSAAILIEVPDDFSQATVLFSGQNGNHLGIRPTTTFPAGSFNLTLPDRLPSSNGSSLVSDLSGNLNWAIPTGGQWVTNGLNIYNSNTGNVGVGVISPTQKFEVEDNSSGFAALIKQVSATGNGLSVYSNTSSSAQTIFQATGNSGGVYIKGNGDVGIGTSSPLVGLNMAGSESLTTLNSNGGSPKTTFRIHNSSQTNHNFSSLSFTTLLSNNGNTEMGKIAVENVNHTLGSQQGDMVFLTRNSSNLNEAMRIDGNGHVGIGIATPDLKIHVDILNAIEVPTTGNVARGSQRFSADDSPLVMDMGVADDTYFGGWIQSHMGSNMSVQYPLLLNPNGGNVGIGTTAPSAMLSVNGAANKPGGGAWTVFSDARSKENVTNYQSGLKELLKMRPVSFNYKSEFGWGDKTYVGLIAQEVEKIVPTMVQKKEVNGISDFREVDPNEITYMLINAVKEQQQLIDVLKENQLKLEEEIKALKK